MSEAMQKSFTAAFDCEAREVNKMRSEMTVYWREPRQAHWEMASAETGFQGGEGSAPVPMAYFMAGMDDNVSAKAPRTRNRSLEHDINSLPQDKPNYRNAITY